MASNAAAYDTLPSLDSARLAAFALGCAERGSGIFLALAGQEEADRLSSLLERAWLAAAGEGDDAEIADIVEEFEARAEASSDGTDSLDAAYFLLHAEYLSVLALAIQIQPSSELGEETGEMLENLLHIIDQRLSGVRSVTVAAGEPTPTGPLQQIEHAAQDRTLRALAELPGSDRLTPEFLTELRASFVPQRDEIASATALLFSEP
ncbi:hypothetical protein AB0H76_02370 [Nocardia sp. NPDC050712]|uniref:hypothetical protein n=1 Tax=Nocardia sp. NPDC050712 TaxID=3155518 RepID=UPI0033E0AE0A